MTGRRLVCAATSTLDAIVMNDKSESSTAILFNFLILFLLV
jgi:hypothetical protein